MKRVLILGGSGFVGRSLCQQLVRQGGFEITVPTRRLRDAQALQLLPGLCIRQAQVSDEAQLRQLLAGQDAVVNLIAILQGSSDAFQQVHVELPRRIAAACRAEGVERLVHVSALGVGEQAPSRYLRSKAAGEAVLQRAGLALSLLRPSVIFGRDDRFLNLFARLQALFPLLPLAGALAQFQPVWVEDVAAALRACLNDPATIDQHYEIAGPEAAPLAHWVRLAGQMSGHPRPLLPLPEAAAWLQALMMECLPGEPLMSRDNLASMQLPNVATGQWPGLAALGIRPRSAASVLSDYMQGEQTQQNDWRRRAGR
ncbi:complex I NDUFA9 subunit family protein [Paucibacter sp. APW11]|uniref:Complex I NDUFA9 subunit family protein n=1 Tax=Roseateles aquae TaxID=3077235 RepID=A0ABU3PAP9_9BURK|nr:complex I NDUFA9 subunit family protein [Paucibacter sp. APW11]MDT8999655.1 complex I NDUFA9 subunit family protein [Paucibacter sp. APW11]